MDAAAVVAAPCSVLPSFHQVSFNWRPSTTRAASGSGKSQLAEASHASVASFCALASRHTVRCDSPSWSFDAQKWLSASPGPSYLPGSQPSSCLKQHATAAVSESNSMVDTYEAEACREVIRELPSELDPFLMPRHVAIIMDGNSRWAKRRGLSSFEGHETGVKALIEVVKLASKWEIKVLTIFAFSTENWLRPKMEVQYLLTLMEKTLLNKKDAIVKYNIQVKFIGDISRLPSSIKKLVTELEKMTLSHTGLKLVVAVSYSGRQDLVCACQQLAQKAVAGSLVPADIDEVLLGGELQSKWGSLDPDFLIRTSGEQRLSNFLLWQLAYTELYFSNYLWPDFHRNEFIAALVEYQRRDRRFGRRDK